MAISYAGIFFCGIIVMVFFGTKLGSAYETIRQQVVTDALTEIPNRRYFFQRLPREFRRCRREGQNLSIIICDIDHFKQYNDTYGHKDGDGCLRRLAQTIRDTLKRPGDFCARYGGEEFVAVLPDTDPEAALHVAEQMRLNIEKLGMEHKGSSTREFVTISLGVATGLCSDDVSHEEIIKKADEALYKAKGKGRNRVEFLD
jgi:diguanylate cyclase (GGDEF)-like protein